MGAKSGVTANFHQFTQTIGGGVITDVENISWVQGSQFADNLIVGGRETPYVIPTTVHGMDGNDTLQAGDYTGYMYGDAGDDLIDAREWDRNLHLIDGGDGSDTIYAGFAYASVYGGAGNDTIHSDNLASGGAGNDTIIMHWDTWWNSAAAFGDEGDDKITAADFRTFLVGGDGSDTLTGGGNDDYLISANSDRDLTWFVLDRLNSWSIHPIDDVGLEHDSLSGGGGDDNLAIGYGDDADGGAGTDTLRLSLAGLTHGIDFDTSGIVSGQPFTLGGGVIQNIEVLTYLRGTELADTLRLATQSTVLTVDAGGGNDTIISQFSSVSVSGGAGDDRFVSGPAADTFDGGAGDDTVDYSAGTVGQWVDLRINAGSGGDSLVNVESILGSAFNDSLTGGDGANTLDGGAGDDLLDGAGGIDTVSYASASTGVTVSLALQGAAQATGGAGLDTLKGFENLTGSAFNDQLNGDGGANVIVGGLGNDTIEGGLGNDTLDGGGGVDMLSYYHAAAGVTVDLTLTTAQNTGAARIDTLSHFQELHGSLYDDVLRAGAGAHTVASYAGADLFYIDNGAAGAYDGGAGIDTLSFAKATSAVKASLATTAVQTTGIGSMSFANFEAVVGTAYADSLTGSGLANTLTGGGGADTLVGGAGADVFRYLLASDSTVAASDLINDFQHGIDKVNLTAIRTGAADKYVISTVGNNTQLDVDLHGDGSIDMRVLLVGKSVLTSADLVW
jgi:Ca2+-binding RTX toxin-like protein